MSKVITCQHRYAEPSEVNGRTLCDQCFTGNGRVRFATADEKSALREAVTTMRLARALERTNWFNTIDAIAEADDDELRLVAGLGPITVRKLRRAIPQKPAPPWIMHATLPTVPVDQALTDAQLPLLAEHIADALVERLAAILLDKLAGHLGVLVP